MGKATPVFCSVSGAVVGRWERGPARAVSGLANKVLSAGWAPEDDACLAACRRVYSLHQYACRKDFQPLRLRACPCTSARHAVAQTCHDKMLGRCHCQLHQCVLRHLEVRLWLLATQRQSCTQGSQGIVSQRTFLSAAAVVEGSGNPPAGGFVSEAAAGEPGNQRLLGATADCLLPVEPCSERASSYAASSSSSFSNSSSDGSAAAAALASRSSGWLAKPEGGNAGLGCSP